MPIASRELIAASCPSCSAGATKLPSRIGSKTLRKSRHGKKHIVTWCRRGDCPRSIILHPDNR